MDLKGKKIVLAGATGGIGSEIAKVLQQEGAFIIPISRSSEFKCDLTDPSQIAQVCEQILTKYPIIDGLINAAGVGIYKTIEDTNLEDWNISLKLNLTAPFLTTKYLLPGLTKSKEAVVVNLGSGMGVTAVADRLPYCTSKFGLRGMSLTLAKEFDGTNIHVVLITLGSVLTEFGPMTLSQKEKESLQGKAYLTPQWVASKLVQIIKEGSYQGEIEIYSPDYAKEMDK